MEPSQTHRHRRRAFGQVGAHLCSRHNSPMNTYCCTDELVICDECASTEHRGHTFGLVRAERRKRQDDLKRLKKRCQELLQQWDSRDALVQEKARETEDFCEAVLTRVIDLLQTHYLSLREQIQALERAAQHEMKARGAAEVKRCSQLDRLAHTDSDVDFLLEWPSVRQHCDRELTEFIEDLHQPFVSLQNTVDSFGNQLEEFCNTRFTTVTQNAPGFDDLVLRTEDEDEDEDEDVQQTEIDSHDQQQSDELTVDEQPLYDSSDEMTGDEQPLYDSSDAAEVTSTVSVHLKTRADFLQYACDLTLDPSTAHEDLHVSSDLKEVRLAPKSGRGPAVRYPERFLHRRQLLCKQGLQADRCYYEVEITGGKTEIALAYKAIDRKRFKQSAFGGNANSWSLDCTSTYYSVSHKGESVQLTSVPKHKRIGVYLKFREGEVSFYEVSDTMKFLYTLQDDFREPLYPGFWIGENCCLKICGLTNDSG